MSRGLKTQFSIDELFLYHPLFGLVPTSLQQPLHCNAINGMDPLLSGCAFVQLATAKPRYSSRFAARFAPKRVHDAVEVWKLYPA